MEQVLNRIGSCEFIPNEKFINQELLGGFCICRYKNNENKNRFVVFSGGMAVAAILFDEFKTCMFRYTDVSHRLKGLQNNLWLYAATVLGNIKHSEHLTDEGKACIK